MGNFVKLEEGRDMRSRRYEIWISWLKYYSIYTLVPYRLRAAGCVQGSDDLPIGPSAVDA
jgi:hypothetical protein